MAGSATEVMRLMEQGVNVGLAEAALAILEEAKKQVPVGVPEELHGDQKPGELRDSGRVTPEPGRRTATISFETPYAAKIHEAIHYRHPHGGKAKYLEDPVKDLAPRLEHLIASPVRKLMLGRH